MAKRDKKRECLDYIKWCKAKGFMLPVQQYYDKSNRIAQLKRDRLHRILNLEIKDKFINDKRAYYRQEYLKSEHWRALKAEKLRLIKKCENCGAGQCLDVHHLNYKNLYDVNVTDLQVLCRACHIREHATYTKSDNNKYVELRSKECINIYESGTSHKKPKPLTDIIIQCSSLKNEDNLSDKDKMYQRKIEEFMDSGKWRGLSKSQIKAQKRKIYRECVAYYRD